MQPVQPLAMIGLNAHLAVMIDWLAENWNFHMWAVIAVLSAMASALFVLVGNLSGSYLY